MSKKFTTDTIKNLKAKIKEGNVPLLNCYKQIEFKPDDSFSLVTEQSGVAEIDNEIITKMVDALKQINKKSWDEFEAGKILFENLSLSPKQASDIGFWTYHNHYTFFQYISKRWGDLWDKVNEVDNPSSYIIAHWIQSNSNASDLMRYPISGLWWSFYLTVDYEREDKYELTKLIFKNETLRTRQLGNARFARHKEAMIGVLEFIKENQIPLEQTSRTLIPYINLLGGIRPLSYLDKNWFKFKLNKRFGSQLKAGQKKIFIQSNEIKENNPDVTISNLTASGLRLETFDRYFCLSAGSGNYMISSKATDNWDYCIGLDFEMKDQYLIHFYQEGKIKKTKVDGGLTGKTVDRSKTYSNGKCPKLTLQDVQLIKKPVLFGIAYKTKNGIFFKAMDEQNLENFRSDNSELNQEGKKVLYADEPFKTSYKVLPYEIKDALGTLVQQSPTSKGAEIANKYYAEKWNTLRPYWPELFNGSIEWK